MEPDDHIGHDHTAAGRETAATGPPNRFVDRFHPAALLTLLIPAIFAIAGRLSRSACGRVGDRTGTGAAPRNSDRTACRATP